MLHAVCEKNQWDYGATSSQAFLSGRAARMDKRTLPAQEPLSESAFLGAAKEASVVAVRILSICGFKTLHMSRWIRAATAAERCQDLVPLMQEYSQLGGGKGFEPWAGEIEELEKVEAAVEQPAQPASSASLPPQSASAAHEPFAYDFHVDTDTDTLGFKRLAEHAAALASGKLVPFDEAWESMRKELEEPGAEVFPAHWDDGSPVCELMGTLKQISSLLLSSPAEELWPLILRIGLYKPHLPRGTAKSANRRPNQNILGRFAAESAKEAAAESAAADKAEIWTSLRRGELVIHGTQLYRVLLIIRRHGKKWHVVPGQIPRAGDTIKLWLRRCVVVSPNEAEKARPTLKCVFADAVEAPILAEPNVLLPLRGYPAQGFIMRAASLKVTPLLNPTPEHKRNMNVFVLHKLLQEAPDALKAEMPSCFQRMAIAFIRNLKGLPTKGTVCKSCIAFVNF